MAPPFGSAGRARSVAVDQGLGVAVVVHLKEDAAAGSFRVADVSPPLGSLVGGLRPVGGSRGVDHKLLVPVENLAFGAVAAGDLAGEHGATNLRIRDAADVAGKEDRLSGPQVPGPDEEQSLRRRADH